MHDEVHSALSPRAGRGDRLRLRGVGGMSARSSTLAAIRANRPKGDFALPAIPAFPPLVGDDHVRAFGEALAKMGGRVFAPADGPDSLAPVRERIEGARVLASSVSEVVGNRDLATVAAPGDLADVDVAVVRAAFGIAETGSVLFTERELVVNSLAYLAQHLVVLLDPADLVPDLRAAYLRPEFAMSAYAVFHTGPSATADIEGVLIHGAQGVRSLTVLMLPRNP